jgi:RND family efflux transporter MFP subunit
VRNYILPILALAGVGLAAISVLRDNGAQSAATTSSENAFQPPYDSYVAGTGIVESSSTNIAIGTNVSGVVADLYADVGTDVNAGDPLFSIDDRLQASEVETRKAQVEVAKSKLDTAEYELSLSQTLASRDIDSKEKTTRNRYAVATAKADLALAEAELNASRAALERYTVQAPVEGRVLQVNARPGEFAEAGPQQEPLVLFGSVSPLHVRVEIDESDAWRVKESAPAAAYLRGNPSINAPLTFVRFEPYVVPKKSLTGDTTERVDSRVLQVVYRLDRGDLPIFIGQLLDVYIEDSVAAE